MSIHIEYAEAKMSGAYFGPESVVMGDLPLDFEPDPEQLVLAIVGDSAHVLTGTREELVAFVQRAARAVGVRVVGS